MNEGSELRAFVVVLVIVGLIVVSFAAISQIDVDDDKQVEAAGPVVREPDESASSELPLSDEQKGVLLCRTAVHFQERIADFADQPILVARAAEDFYAEVVEYAPSDVAPEYVQAADYYRDFNDVGDPLGYDTERILREGDGLRWEQLVTREPFSVSATQAHLLFTCAIDLPDPYREDPSDFNKLKQKIDRELNPERYRPTSTTTAPASTTG